LQVKTSFWNTDKRRFVHVIASFLYFPGVSGIATLYCSLGMVLNLYAIIAYSTNGPSRYLAFQGAKTSLSNKEKEAVNLVVSQVNGCRYCQSAHTVLGGLNGFSKEEILSIRKGTSNNHKLNALVTLAKAITEKKGRVNDKLLDEFFAVG